MHYNKIALPEPQLLMGLWNKGLRIDDPKSATRALETIGYYRLLIYMRNFQVPTTKRFFVGTKFSDIIELYDFDRHLRLLVLDGIERIEVSLRAALSSKISITHDPHWYMDVSHFDQHIPFVQSQQKIIFETGPESKTRWIALQHYYTHYTTPPLPASWTVMERLTFGVLSRFYAALKLPNRKLTEVVFGFDEKILVSWFHSISFLRNQCAHHGQLWNTKLNKFFALGPNAYRQDFLNANRNELYPRLVAMNLLLKNTFPESQWGERLKSLVNGCRHVQPSSMGFPAGWETRPSWN